LPTLNLGDTVEPLEPLPGSEEEAYSLVSLWAVPEAATVLLMTEFYRHVFDGCIKEAC
jgi:hypothetical protein